MIGQLDLTVKYLGEMVGPHDLGPMNDIYHFDNWWQAGPNLALSRLAGVV